MKKILSLILAFALLPLFLLTVSAEEPETNPLEINAKAALLMDASTGRILYAYNADEALSPASVTKIMTLLLIMEAIESGKISLSDTVTVSKEAASMGGSQVFLEEGETMSVEEMIKCIVISSANDAACAMAEHIAGSEGAFVSLMNRRAEELGLKSSHFENTNGLDDTTVNHVMSARDIAIISKELIAHEKILEYTTVWMDTIRNGAFTLTNTNRLVRFYPGATGLKTGSTAKALFCMSATAKREDLHLIAVIMGAPSRDIRNNEAKRLLDYGFANYSLYQNEGADCGELSVAGGVKEKIAIESMTFEALLSKGKEKDVTVKLLLPKKVAAPINKGDLVGKLEYSLNGEIIGTSDIVAKESSARISFSELFWRMTRAFLSLPENG